jgi:hypothetical protein
MSIINGLPNSLPDTLPKLKGIKLQLVDANIAIQESKKE